MLRQRRELGCEHIKIFGDVKKKHCSHALTGDLDIVDVVKQSEFFLVDGVIVTGPRTGESPDLRELPPGEKGRSCSRRHRLGPDPENIGSYLLLADGFIVGSTLREDGAFLGRLDPARLQKFVRSFRRS